ncbi:hypothetical protein [Nostoc mirabile]|uniref:hypothetical protein n=1 Tax=Nostoc mirabile TaxID=2907820 RepID=UPI0027DFF0E6|nr:hypothetical protein [Nostoc mirabile]
MSAANNDDYSYVDQNFQPESLQTWGKRGSVINVEMRCYRESVLGGLVEDGYTVIGVKLRKMDDCQEWANQW